MKRKNLLLVLNYSIQILLIVERLVAWGHPYVRATHRTTLEFTKEEHLTPKGDCIVAVRAERGPLELNPEFREAIRTEDSRVVLELEVGGFREVVSGFGSPRLTLSHPTDFVLRKSRYTCPRTLMTRADKAAHDIPRPLIKLLQNHDTLCRITLIAYRSEATGVMDDIKHVKTSNR